MKKILAFIFVSFFWCGASYGLDMETCSDYAAKAKTNKAAKAMDARDKTRSTLKNAPRSIAEAKRQGKATYIDKNGNTKAAVTAEDLKKSGHKTLRAYLNAKGKPVKKKDNALVEAVKSKTTGTGTNRLRAASTPVDTTGAKADAKVKNKREKLKIKGQGKPKTRTVKGKTFYLQPNGKSYLNVNLNKEKG